MDKRDYANALDNLIELIVTSPFDAWMDKKEEFAAVIKEQPIMIPKDIRDRQCIILSHDELWLHDKRLQRVARFRDRLMFLSEQRKQYRIEEMLKVFLD